MGEVCPFFGVLTSFAVAPGGWGGARGDMYVSLSFCSTCGRGGGTRGSSALEDLPFTRWKGALVHVTSRVCGYIPLRLAAGVGCSFRGAGLGVVVSLSVLAAVVVSIDGRLSTSFARASCASLGVSGVSAGPFREGVSGLEPVASLRRFPSATSEAPFSVGLVTCVGGLSVTVLLLLGASCSLNSSLWELEVF